MKNLFGLAALLLAALTFTLASCQNENKDDTPTAYTITIASTIKNGTVTANKTSTVSGDTVKLTATPDDGYQLGAYSVMDASNNAITVTEGTFTMPASNVTVSAIFTKTEATLNQEAANAVIAKINAIGNVAYTTESKTKIDEARTAYNALTEAQKALISAETLAVLTTAESTYESLITYTVTVVSGITNGSVTASASSATAGTTITLTITPYYDYTLGSLSVKNGDTDVDMSGAGNTRTFYMPAGNVTVNATFKKVVAETKAAPDAVGDIVLSDGTAVAKENAGNMSSAQKAAAVAVIFYKGTSSDVLGEKTLGVGLHNATGKGNTLRWAPSGTTGYTTEFDEIICTPSASGTGVAETATFEGDIDGNDNWSKVCAADTTAEENAAANYPAFNWVNNYASTYSLAGDNETGWYLPTVAELSMMYRGKDTVNAALEKASGTKIADAVYCSSSQYSSINSNAWIVRFDDGTLAIASKDGTLSVCAVRAF